MKVVLINMRTSYIMSIPFGITYLGAVLKEAGHDVKLFDIYPNDELNEVINDLNAFHPDLIGFSLLTTNFHKASSFAGILKSKFPGSKFCAGGIHPTVRPKDTLEKMELDFVVMGEGENVLTKVCNALENNDDISDIKSIAFYKNGSLQINEGLDIVDDLDCLPFPARDMLQVSRYLIPPGYIRSHFLNRVLSVFTSRGCPARCTFCNSSSIFHRKIRRRSVANVISEIKSLIDKHKIDGIYFHDETFTMKSDWVKDICKELKPLGLSWGCQTRVALVNEELLKVMRSAGCLQIDFGVESLSERVLKLIKKGQKPGQIKNAIELTRRAGIKSFASIMIGLPDETEKDLIENVNFLKMTKPDFTYFNLFTPFPGTEAAEVAIKNGKLSEDFFSKDYDMLIETVPLVNLSAMTTETVMRYHRKLRNMVFCRNYIGVLTKQNMVIIFEALLAFLLSPVSMIRSVVDLLRTRNIEKFVFSIFSCYQRSLGKKNKTNVNG